MKIEIAPADYEHVDALLAHGVRQCDWRECYLTTGLAVDLALKAALKDADVAGAVYADNEIVAMFGVTPRDGAGEVWLCGGEFLSDPKNALRLTRAARRTLQLWLSHYRELNCLVDPQNVNSIAWLKRLGFVRDDEPARGPLGHELYRMWRR